MELSVFSDESYMKQAIDQAQIAFDKGEVPVGAVLVHKQKIIAKTHNLTEQLNDFTAHAEMLAFTSGSEYFSNKYLNECTLYVTLEPCVMCAGASFWTRVGKIVYAASDEKRGFSRLKTNILHPKTSVVKGVLEDKAKELLISFFNTKR